MDEQIDIINEKNVIIGASGKTRAHREGLLHRIVIGEIINSKGQYCFVQQAANRQDPGQFVSPIGGHVQKGERIEDALCRECLEEVGFTPVDLKYVGSTIFEREIIGRHENHYFLVYVIHHDGPITLNHESVAHRWFSIAEIKSLLQSKPATFGAAWHHVFKNCFPNIYTSI